MKKLKQNVSKKLLNSMLKEAYKSRKRVSNYTPEQRSECEKIARDLLETNIKK